MGNLLVIGCSITALSALRKKLEKMFVVLTFSPTFDLGYRHYKDTF